MLTTCHEAKWWNTLEGKNKVQCYLCPHYCKVGDGEIGICGVRQNQKGKLYSLSYGRPVATAVDPIEKKPLSEFLPGSKTFSIGTFGCNLNCLFCQNASLACGSYDDYECGYLSPGSIVALAQRHECLSVAFTYNEPTMFAEYAIDIAELAHAADLKTILVSNAFITKPAAKELYAHIDAANFDMKGFSDDFYQNITGSRLQPVLDAIAYYYSLGKHMEITNLILPDYNDSKTMISNFLDWIEANLDKSVPLHFSAFYPTHKMHDTMPTPASTIHRVIKYANARGFNHVYSGNI